MVRHPWNDGGRRHYGPRLRGLKVCEGPSGVGHGHNGRRGQRVDLHLREHEVPPGSESLSHWWASARQLHPNVPRQLRAVAEQRANRICRSSRLGADRPRVCGADA
eukprot:scaffold49512_cov77-Phaeocystis_antarctica.AAC.1